MLNRSHVKRVVDRHRTHAGNPAFAFEMLGDSTKVSGRARPGAISPAEVTDLVLRALDVGAGSNTTRRLSSSWTIRATE